MTRPHQVAGNMLRALRPGGRLIAEFGGYGNVAEVRRAVDVALEELALLAVEGPWCPWYFPRLGEYATVLETAGFVVRSSTWFPRPSPMPDSEAQSGIMTWLEIFASALLHALPAEKRQSFAAIVER